MPDSLPTIVTAADALYGRSLYQFLLSAERGRHFRRNRFVVYDLGMTPAQRAGLGRRFPTCEFRDFDFASFPPHVALAARSYAWKPILISEIAHERGGRILWLDSATILKTKNFLPVWSAIRRDGVLVLKGQSSLRAHCDPLVLAALGVPAEFQRRPELVAGVVGLDMDRECVRDVVKAWRDHALNPAHIAPRRPPLPSHKPEQALLTILLYACEAKGGITLPDAEIDISSARPVRWMSSRNKVSSRAPVWTDPLIRLYYWTYKTADRWLWKLRHFEETRIHGLDRFGKEHFSVLLIGAGGEAIPVRAPRWCYYADPFLVPRQDGLWLLAEKFDYRTCRGELCAMKLDAELRAGPPVGVLPGRRHMSFPATFELEGRTYLVPETSADRTVEIHACVEFPARWRLVRFALEDVDAADSFIFRHDSLWWLITSLRVASESPQRFLAVYYTDDVLTGAWRPHPVNANRLYQDRGFGYGRNGGPILSWNGTLLRPMQSSSRYYGESLTVMEIATLTTEDFAERPLAQDHPAGELARRYSPHHLSMAEGVAALDIRDRSRPLQLLRPRRQTVA